MPKRKKVKIIKGGKKGASASDPTELRRIQEDFRWLGVGGTD